MQCICGFLWSTVTYLVATQAETVASLGSDLKRLNNSVAKAVVFQKHQELQDAREKKQLLLPPESLKFSASKRCSF